MEKMRVAGEKGKWKEMEKILAAGVGEVVGGSMQASLSLISRVMKQLPRLSGPQGVHVSSVLRHLLAAAQKLP
ncbi:hypothetical protein EYF80_055019 [Liparis tanakae]|uniref:Uncharacterized protein n=1 Tax=Liparis tanakae TaxID=230148 RepID=A0A4Z2F0T2_9TELE|nr:hypothetical protein EYF80_055019 [Liparis tanakae]